MIADIPISKKQQIFKNLTNDIASHYFSADHFEQEFVNYPKFQIPVTKGEKSNLAEYVKAVRKFIANEISTGITQKICSALNIIDDNGNLDPSQSIYAKYFKEILNSKAQSQVVNREEFMMKKYELEFDKKYHLEPDFVALILASLAHSGDIVVTYTGKKIKIGRAHV